jgi:hypothetical protein
VSAAQGNRERSDSVRRRLERLRDVLAWPRLYGWIGIVFLVAGVWFVLSWGLLRSAAGRMEPGGAGAREAALGTRGLGFGEGFLRPVLRFDPRTKERTLPDPLLGSQLERARLAVRANATGSGVFGLFCLFAAAAVWALRLLDPALREPVSPSGADE